MEQLKPNRFVDCIAQALGHKLNHNQLKIEVKCVESVHTKHQRQSQGDQSNFSK